VQFHQSNHEGQLIDWVQAARADCGAIIINPAGYTTTSVALLDALRTFDGLIIEVHISNIYRREAFRHHSYVAMAATGTICGLGSLGYTLALQAVADRLGTLRQL
jgi:3-dehydroquinate dehydratase-2